jgi:hypothetical protein
VVHDGQRSQRINVPGKFQAGIMQGVGANLQWDYQVSAWYHLDERSGGTCRLGVDPAGGTDPASAGVRWSEGNKRGNWVQLVVRVTAAKRAITIFLEASSEGGIANAYFDEVVLAPYPCPLKEPEKPETPAPEPQRVCVDWRDEQKARDLGKVYERNGFTFQGLSQENLRIATWGPPQGQGKLVIARTGLQVALPFVASTVTATVTMGTSQPVTLKSLDKDGKTIDQVATPGESGKIHTLVANKPGIVSVVIAGGGGEGLLIELCIEGEGGAVADEKEAAPPGKENVVTNVVLVAQPQATVKETKKQTAVAASKTQTTAAKSQATRTAPKAKTTRLTNR